jgi:hypothetical protein
MVTQRALRLSNIREAARADIPLRKKVQQKPTPGKTGHRI